MAAGTLTLNSDLVTNTSGIITVDSTGSLDLTGSDTINNGQLNNNGGLIKVTGTGNEIENETGGTAFTSGTNSFSNTGTPEVAGTLTLNSDLVTNSGGIITVDSTGTLDLTGSDTINNGQLNNNGGLIKVTGTGNEIENESGSTAFTSGTNSFTNTGTLEVLAGGVLTLNSDLVTNTSGIITVDSTGTLDLTGSDTINNGQLNNNGGLIKVTGTGNEIENESGGTAFTSGTNSFTNTGTLEVAGTLTLNSDLVTNTSGIITVDSTGTLDLTGSDTINNGQLNNNGGLIKVTGTGNEIENESGGTAFTSGTNSFSNTGTLEVAGTLTLNSDLVTNTSGIITVDSTGTLDLTGSDTINNGQLNNNGGQIKVSGTGNLIENESGGTAFTSGTNSFSNTGTLEVAGTLTLSDDKVESSATIDVDSGATLTLDDGTQIIGAGTGTLTIASGATLSLDDTSSVTGSIVTVDSGGTVDVKFSGAADDMITASDGGTVIITDDELGAGGAFGSGATITATNGTLTIENGSSFGSNASVTTTDAGTTLTITGGSSFGSNAIVSASGGSTLIIEGSSTFGNSVSVEATGGSSLTIEGGASLAAADTITLSSGTTAVDGTEIVGFGTLSGNLTNIASIEADGGTLNITGLTTGTVSATVDASAALVVGAAGHTVTFSSASNLGTIEVAAGTLDITGAVSPATGFGSASTQIDAGATLELGSSDAETVAFNGANATLHLDATSSFTGNVTGFAVGDMIDLGAVDYNLVTTYGTYTGNSSGGTLTVTDAHGDSVAVQLVGNYTTDYFAGSLDSNGDTLVTLENVDTAPVITAATSGSFTEVPGQTGVSTPDTATGTIGFTDIDLTNRPTISAPFTSYTYTDAHGNPLTLPSADTTAVEAALTLTQSGENSGSASWTYSVPDDAFDFLAQGETLTLTYTATVDDHHGDVVTTPITVTITGTNDAPTIVTGSTTATGAITELPNETGDSALDHAGGTIAFADVDLDDTHTVSQAAPTFLWSGGTLSAGQISALTADGTLTLTETDSTGSGSGSVAWAYSAADDSFDFLAQGETLTVTYDVTVTDNNNAAATQAVTVTVTGSNDAPVAVADTGAVVAAGVSAGDVAVAGTPTATGNVLTNDTDPDLDDTHSVVGVATGTQTGVLSGDVGTAIVGTYGDLTVNADGTYTYTLANGQANVVALAQGQTAQDIFSYTESDNHGATSTTTLTITVTGTDDAPTPSAVSTTVNEDATAATTTRASGVLGTSTDPDTGDTATLVVSAIAAGTSGTPTAVIAGTPTVVAGTYGELTINADGTYSYVADNTAAQAHEHGAQAQDVFTYTAEDTTGATTTATLTFGINPEAPSVSAPPTLAVAEGGTVPLVITETPFDANDPVTITITGMPSDASLSAGTENPDGSWTLTPAQLSGLMLTAGDETQTTLSITATNTDGLGASNSTSISLAVNPTQPTVMPVAVSGVEGYAILLNLGLTVTGELGDGNSLHAVTIGNIPSGATLHNTNGDTLTVAGGSITFTAAQIADNVLAGLSITPVNDGVFTLNVSAQEQAPNGSNLSTIASNSESLTVNPTAPTVTWSPSPASGTEDSGIALTLAAIANGLSGDANALTSLTVTLPTGATLTDGTHTFTATPGNDTTGNLVGWTLTGLSVTPASGAGFSLTATATETGANGTTSSTTTSETVTVTPQYGHLWGTSVVTEPGDHLYNVFVSSNSNANEGAIIFGTTPTADYTPGGYNSVTENVALYDPFVLAFRSGTDGIETSFTEVPAKNQVIVPSGTESIAFYVTQDMSGNSTVYQEVLTYASGANGSPSNGSPTIIDQDLAGTINALDVSYSTYNSSGTNTSAMTSYATAWGLYSSSSTTYQIDLETFPVGGSASGVLPIETFLGHWRRYCGAGLAVPQRRRAER